MGKRRRASLTDQLRRAIDESGETRYAIGKAAGVDQATLSRFCSGERGLSMEAMDRLGAYLELKLVSARRKSSGPRGSRGKGR
jgi:hypothetical protein